MCLVTISLGLLHACIYTEVFRKLYDTDITDHTCSLLAYSYARIECLRCIIWRLHDLTEMVYDSELTIWITIVCVVVISVRVSYRMYGLVLASIRETKGQLKGQEFVRRII